MNSNFQLFGRFGILLVASLLCSFCVSGTSLPGKYLAVSWARLCYSDRATAGLWASLKLVSSLFILSSTRCCLVFLQQGAVPAVWPLVDALVWAELTPQAPPIWLCRVAPETLPRPNPPVAVAWALLGPPREP